MPVPMPWRGAARCGPTVPDLQALRNAAAGLLPGVAVAATDPRAPQPPLFSGETLHAIPARLREFAAGRAAARQAMCALGADATAIPIGPDRAPVWPPGLQGSITHSATACLAAVTRGGLLGVDIEPDLPLDDGLWTTVLTADELQWLATQRDQGHAAMQIFCAKEATYKAQYPATGALFGFDALRISLHGDHFTATFCQPAGPIAIGTRWQGRMARAGGHVLATMHLPAPVPRN